MSFADGLLHEKQDRDEKTRNEVRAVIERLNEAYEGRLQLASEKSKILEDAMKYLRQYEQGRHLI